ncbi:fimbrial protein [Serratia sp. NFX21]|uniref:fimbrial protein n=1 Tax=Serratia sp. NFX21 TaxID=3402279 RepID=UPI003AF3520D
MSKANGMAVRKSRKTQQALCAACLILLTTAIPSVEATTSTITVKVTITAPPCEINNNKLIEVDFGNDVLTTRVDGNYKKRPVDYSVQCKGGSSNSVRMLIEGDGAVFDGDVLLTNKTDFGIEIRSNGNRMPIKRWLNFTYPNWPTLEAVPVKRPGATLTGGPFSAGATMKVEYL